ncbi:hypothetical protein [Streptomyces sp. NPDC005970]|uniref:hypothetical protein n=1 Tax=Streptomyces sp. NPDC005970 TaxID=3156723 RepID=UPI0033C6E780
MDDRAQLPRICQDFDRGISFWSRKVWKAVGLAGEAAGHQVGHGEVFSRANRRTSSFTASAVGGRPGLLRRSL